MRKSLCVSAQYYESAHFGLTTHYQFANQVNVFSKLFSPHRSLNLIQMRKIVEIRLERKPNAM